MKPEISCMYWCSIPRGAGVPVVSARRTRFYYVSMNYVWPSKLQLETIVLVGVLHSCAGVSGLNGSGSTRSTEMIQKWHKINSGIREAKMLMGITVPNICIANSEEWPWWDTHALVPMKRFSILSASTRIFDFTIPSKELSHGEGYIVDLWVFLGLTKWNFYRMWTLNPKPLLIHSPIPVWLGMPLHRGIIQLWSVIQIDASDLHLLFLAPMPDEDV